jgi:hypothetical protein
MTIKAPVHAIHMRRRILARTSLCFRARRRDRRRPLERLPSDEGGRDHSEDDDSTNGSLPFRSTLTATAYKQTVFRTSQSTRERLIR